MPTYHLEDPKEGHEVAGLCSLQLEEFHRDDGERHHEESWVEEQINCGVVPGPSAAHISLLCPGQGTCLTREDM